MISRGYRCRRRTCNRTFDALDRESRPLETRGRRGLAGGEQIAYCAHTHTLNLSALSLISPLFLSLSVTTRTHPFSPLSLSPSHSPPASRPRSRGWKYTHTRTRAHTHSHKLCENARSTCPRRACLTTSLFFPSQFFLSLFWRFPPFFLLSVEQSKGFPVSGMPDLANAH